MIAATAVALATHAYQHKLPKSLKKAWYLHYGAYKAAGLTSLIIVVVSQYGGGQI